MTVEDFAARAYALDEEGEDVDDITVGGSDNGTHGFVPQSHSFSFPTQYG